MTEEEYKAIVVTASEAIWLRQVLDGMGLDQEDATNLYCDNQSTIKLAKNPVFHATTKHIEVHHHFIRDLIQNGDIKLLYKPTEDQIADIFTKPLARDKFQKFRDGIGVKCNDVNIKGKC